MIMSDMFQVILQQWTHWLVTIGNENFTQELSEFRAIS